MTKKQKTNLIRIIVSAVLVAGIWLSSLTGWLEGVLYLLPYFIVGYDILLKAVKGIFRGQVFDENFLMAVATVGAMALGDWREGCAVMVFYQVGELFQSYAVGKSRRSISDLMDIRPDYANIESGGTLEKVDPDDVAVGTVIVVQPGERIPIDGVVTEGESAVNTSALTGESLPRQVKAGDEVTLMGRDGEEFISVETLGDLSGRFSYEFVCGISKRVPRVYIKDGKECGEEESFFQ